MLNIGHVHFDHTLARLIAFKVAQWRASGMGTGLADSKPSSRLDFETTDITNAMVAEAPPADAVMREAAALASPSVKATSQSARELPVTVRAVPRSRPDLRVFAAGVRALLVHGAAACLRVQVTAVTVGATRQGKDAVLEVEMVDQAGLFQTLGNLLGRVVFGLERVHQTQTHQIGHAHFDGHGAAVGCTAVTQAAAVAGPGVAAVNVDNGYR